MGRHSSRSRSPSPRRKRKSRNEGGPAPTESSDTKSSSSSKKSRVPPPPPPPPPPPVSVAKLDFKAIAESLALKSSGDGEVSLSVNDTNSLRVRLGLKPLNSEHTSSATAEREVAERNFELARSARNEARRLADIESELARARRRRESKQELAGERLGDGEDAESLGAAEWVRRSRQRAKTGDGDLAKLEAEKRAKLFSEQDEAYSAQDLEGLAVSAHSAADLRRGDGLILTLKDEQILHYDESKHGKLAGLTKVKDGEAECELENVDRAEEAQRKRKLDSSRKDAVLAGGAGYDATDDHEFAAGATVGPGGSRYSSGLLGKYDESDVGEVALRLGAKGRVSADDQSHLSGAALAAVADTITGAGEQLAALPGEGEAISMKIGRWSAKPVDVGAANSEFAPQREYMTAEEAALLFKKKKPSSSKKDKSAKKQQQPKSFRKKPATGASVLDDLGEEEASSADRGSRGSRKPKQDTATEQAATRAANYATAQRKAQDKLQRGLGDDVPMTEADEPERLKQQLLAASRQQKRDADETAASRAKYASGASSQADKPQFVAGLGDEEDDLELQSALSRARCLNSRAAKTEDCDDGATAVARAKAEVKSEFKAEESLGEGLVFTSTTEFTARLHARLEERAAENAEAQQAAEFLAAAAAETEASEEAAAAAAAAAANVKQEGDEEMDDADVGDEEMRAMAEAEGLQVVEVESEDEEGDIEFMHKQPLAKNGMGATMALLRRTGDIQLKHKEQKIGRARDARRFEDGTELVDDPHVKEKLIAGQSKPIKLEYRDEHGRLLTRKEAFRQMCHKFHGKTPGKKKTEKATERYKESQRAIAQSAGAGSLSILQHAQKRTGQAYVPINNQTAYAAMGQPAPEKKKKKKKRED